MSQRLIWLREKLGRNLPQNTICELVGTYNPTNHAVIISLVISIEGTEYRVIRYNKTMDIGDNTDSLKTLHKNMIAYMITTYRNCELKVLVDKFIQWTPNPTYKQIMKKFNGTS